MEVQTADGDVLDTTAFAIKTIDPTPYVAGSGNIFMATVIIDGVYYDMPMEVSTAMSEYSVVSPEDVKDKVSSIIADYNIIDQTTTGTYNTATKDILTGRKISTAPVEFQFGISGEHLLFSHPVEITKKVDFPDGLSVSL